MTKTDNYPFVNSEKHTELIVIGGGLAGSEAAWQAAQRGLSVRLYEMRPHKPTGAHVGDRLAELVCSNSLGSNLRDRASGLLKAELRMMGSLLIACAEETAVPAGGALAVDREAFSQAVTEKIASHPRITIIREEVREIPEGLVIIASGPLTSPTLSNALARLTGEEHLYFFDAISPIISEDSINYEVAFRASRYENGMEEEGDYINCPFNKEEYELFIQELLHAERIELKDFELNLETGVKAGAHEFFEGCLPVEILAKRGKDALAFGPMRPVGLKDPRTGRRPYAVVQLRQDNLHGTLYNMVGFQTNLKFEEQRRVFRLIPGLEQAVFERFGQMHRNTFVFSPRLLEPTFQMRHAARLFLAGQITGIEGYAGNIATGLVAGINAARLAVGQTLLTLPRTCMTGALAAYITEASAKDFQPMKANFGILPPLEISGRSGRRQRAEWHVERALQDLETYLDKMACAPAPLIP